MCDVVSDDSIKATEAKKLSSAPDNGPNQWSNDDNDAFYSDVRADGLRKFAIRAGLINGCDVKQLKPYWKSARNVLDASSGYGRVVGALLEAGFQGKITAAERNSEQHACLLDTFEGRAQIFQIDTRDLVNLDEQYDVIFLLWSGLADFPKHEQPNIVSLLSNLLNNDGKLIIDTMPMDTKPLNTEQFGKQSFLTKSDKCVVHTYEANYSEIQEYARACGLSHLELLKCRTDTNRERWLYILSR